MRSQEKRIEKLENRNPQIELPTIERVIYDSREQARHRERFKKVLDEEEVTETGCKIRKYHLERIVES